MDSVLERFCSEWFWSGEFVCWTGCVLMGSVLEGFCSGGLLFWRLLFWRGSILRATGKHYTWCTAEFMLGEQTEGLVCCSTAWLWWENAFFTIRVQVERVLFFEVVFWLVCFLYYCQLDSGHQHWQSGLESDFTLCHFKWEEREREIRYFWHTNDMIINQSIISTRKIFRKSWQFMYWVITKSKVIMLVGHCLVLPTYYIILYIRFV